VAFTDNCDRFASLHEDGVNRVITHIRQQRPSWFNYATVDIAANRELWCFQDRVVPKRPLHSHRSATMGSTFAALRAGM
jgi:hypothetical protein